MSTKKEKQAETSKGNQTSAQVDALVIRKHYRCKGCGAFLEETEVEKYGDGFCHVLPYYDQNGNAEPMPCGPVSEITEPVKYMILETDMIEIMNTLERIISPEAPFKKDKLEFAHSVIDITIKNGQSIKEILNKYINPSSV